MTHPSETSLALHAGGDLVVWARWRISRHAVLCEGCRTRIEAFRSAREQLRDDLAELPPELNWGRLAGEMKANIRLGLIAGAIVEPDVATPQRLGWRAAAGLALAASMVLTGWFLNIPRPGQSHPGVVLEATEAGLELRENGRTLTMLQPASATVTYTVNAERSMRARYVDSDTGQVTITNVYAQ